jgi:DNA-directed RNA polymerase sigma subunit (sigma70/sigma32)
MTAPSPLTVVRRARLKRVRAESEYRAAIKQASEAGHSLREIAVEAGVTHTRVRQIVLEP